MQEKVKLLFAILCVMMCCTAKAQSNVYVNIKNKVETECVPRVSDVRFEDGWMLVDGLCQRKYQVDSVERVAFRDAGLRFERIVPRSVMNKYHFEMPWLNSLETIDTEAESIVYDQNAEGYSDFVENNVFTNLLRIRYDETSGKASVDGEVGGVSIEIDGGKVVVYSEAQGVEYELSGQSANGSFKLYSSNKAKITLNGVSLKSATGAAINIQSKKRMYVVLKDGSQNSIEDGKKYNTPQDEDEKGCLFSEGQLCFSGKGSLMVYGRYKHGIVSDQYIRISDGKIQIETTAEKGAGIKGKDGFIMGGGYVQAFVSGDAAKAVTSDSTIVVTGGVLNAQTTGGVVYVAEEDDYSSCCALKADGDITLTGGKIRLMSTGTAGKGMTAGRNLTIGDNKNANCKPEIYVKTLGKRIPEIKESNDIIGPSSSPKGIKAMGNIEINSGIIRVNAIGGDGAEGVESKGSTTINNGDIACFCIDDVLNANDGLTINDGSLVGASLTNDGLDVIWLYCNGGNTYVVGGSGDQTAFDTDGKTFYNRGGTHLGIGGMMCGNTDYRSNNCSVNATIRGNYKYLALIDDAGIASVAMQIPDFYTPNKRGYNYGMLMCSPKIQQNTHYRLCGANVLLEGEEKDGEIVNAKFEDISEIYDFTTNKVNTLLQ